ncbi:hypothetical protein ACE3MZ_17395 [Paenibacillus sp. WLX1005]
MYSYHGWAVVHPEGLTNLGDEQQVNMMREIQEYVEYLQEHLDVF